MCNSFELRTAITPVISFYWSIPEVSRGHFAASLVGLNQQIIPAPRHTVLYRKRHALSGIWNLLALAKRSSIVADTIASSISEDWGLSKVAKQVNNKCIAAPASWQWNHFVERRWSHRKSGWRWNKGDERWRPCYLYLFSSLCRSIRFPK